MHKHLTEEHRFLLFSVTVINIQNDHLRYAYQNLTFNILHRVAELKGYPFD